MSIRNIHPRARLPVDMPSPIRAIVITLALLPVAALGASPFEDYLTPLVDGDEIRGWRDSYAGLPQISTTNPANNTIATKIASSEAEDIADRLRAAVDNYPIPPVCETAVTGYEVCVEGVSETAVSVEIFDTTGNSARVIMADWQAERIADSLDEAAEDGP